jgi:hypothetical protein
MAAITLGCFVIVSAYGFLWPKLSDSNNAANINLKAGH